MCLVADRYMFDVKPLVHPTENLVSEQMCKAELWALYLHGLALFFSMQGPSPGSFQGLTVAGLAFAFRVWESKWAPYALTLLSLG